MTKDIVLGIEADDKKAARDDNSIGRREESLRSLQPLAYLAGANALMGGDYLTTKGRAIEEDISDMLDLGLTPWGRTGEV